MQDLSQMSTEELLRMRQAAQQGQQPAPNRAPGIIRGAPSQAERRAEEDQILEREKFARQQAVEEERLRLAREAETRASEQAQRGGVEQGKAASFLRRAINAEQNFRSLGEVGPRTLPGQAVKDAFPNVANIMSDSERQRADQAEREFIGAILRYDSGAAIPPEEFVTNGQIYFPRPGDTPEVLAQKAEARRVAIEGLYAAAGPAGQQIEMPDFSQPVKPKQADKRDEMPYGAQLAMDDGNDDPFDRARYLQERFGIDPGSETRLVGMLNANNGNPNVSPDMVLRMYRDAGVPPPAEQDLAELVEDMRSGRFAPASQIDTGAAREAYTQGLDQALRQQGVDPNSAADSALFGAARGATFGLSDEITGIGEAIGAALQGKNPVAAYQVNRDLVRRFAERSQNESPVSAYGSEFAGGLLTGGVGAAGRVNSVGQAARVGAIQGGIAGFGYGEGAVGSALGATVGTPTGALLGAGFQAGGNKIQNALANRQQNALVENSAELAAASQRRDVPLRPYDTNPRLQGKRAELLQSEKGRNAIQQADMEDRAAMEAAVTRDLGGETSAYRAGDVIQEGGLRAREQMRQRAGRLYTKAEKLSQGVAVTPTRAIEVIDQNLAELQAAGPNQNRAIIAELTGLREDLSREGGLTVAALRSQRTGMRDSLKANNLDKTDAERRVTQVLDAAGEDIARGLQGNPEALSAFRQADQIWREQARFKKQILDKILGPNAENPKSPEATAAAVQNFVSRDFKRARELFAQLDDAERSEVRDLVASSLGRNNRGEFSVDLFLTHTGAGKGAKVDDRSLRLIFGQEGVEAIKDLRALAQAKSNAASQTNRSNTGGVVQRAARGLRTAMLGAFGFAEGGVTGGVVAPMAMNFISSLGDRRAARLLTNPKFTKWLRQTPESTDPAVINRHFDRLRSLASRSPAMVTDVQVLERALIEAANDNSMRLAAEPSGADNQR